MIGCFNPTTIGNNKTGSKFLTMSYFQFFFLSYLKLPPELSYLSKKKKTSTRVKKNLVYARPLTNLDQRNKKSIIAWKLAQ